MKFTLEITKGEKLHVLITDDDGSQFQLQTETLTGDRYKDRASIGNFYHNLVETLLRRVHPEHFPEWKVETLPDGTKKAIAS